MAERKPMIKRLVNGGIYLCRATVCSDAKYAFPYAEELARSISFETGKMIQELKSPDSKKRAKGQRKKDLVDSGGKLVEPLDMKSQEEWKEFMLERYRLNTPFIDDLREFESLGRMFSDLPDDRNGFTNEGAVPLEQRVGFRAHDGAFWTFDGVELNGNNLDVVFGRGSFNRVVVQAYEKQSHKEGQSVYQLLHVHDEPLEYWGHEALFVSAPGGRGSTLNAALTELNEETQYQLESTISSLRITGYFDEVDLKIRHYFIEVEGAVEVTETDRVVTPTFFEAFTLKNNPADKKDHIKYLVPRRGGQFDAKEVFKAIVLPSPKTIDVKSRSETKKYSVYVDVSPILSRLKVRRTPETQLLRFSAATRPEIYETLLSLA